MVEQEEVELVEIKRENRLFHDVEAKFFEAAHPEGSSVYERTKVLRDFSQIMKYSVGHGLCVDVGCGTGFITGFELSRYGEVVAQDISTGMIEVIKDRFGKHRNLNLLICDAENLPLRHRITDLVSVGSVLHHLPRPFRAILEAARTLRQGGILYIIREPNDWFFSRFFAFLDYVINMVGMFFLPPKKSASPVIGSFDQSKVHVRYPRGFNVQELIDFCLSNGFQLVSGHSYHWIFPKSDSAIVAELSSKINFLVEKVPLSKRLGRYVCIIMKKEGPSSHNLLL